jgi:hypothetical protein
MKLNEASKAENSAIVRFLGNLERDIYTGEMWYGILQIHAARGSYHQNCLQRLGFQKLASHQLHSTVLSYHSRLKKISSNA